MHMCLLMETPLMNENYCFVTVARPVVVGVTEIMFMLRLQSLIIKSS